MNKSVTQCLQPLPVTLATPLIRYTILALYKFIVCISVYIKALMAAQSNVPIQTNAPLM